MSVGISQKPRPVQHTVAISLSAILLSSGLPPPLWARPTDHTPAAPTSVDPSTLRIPERLGQIVEVFHPEPRTPNPERLVIHLQDLHTQEDAQRNLAKLIHQVRRATGASLIALEGATGPGDTSFFSAFPDPALNRRLAGFFLKQGLFTGPVAYAVTHPGAVRLYGVEDPALYLDHLKTYQTTSTKQAELAGHVQSVRAALYPLQDSLFPLALNTLLKQTQAFEEGRFDLTAYLNALLPLARQHGLTLEPYPTITRLLRLNDAEPTPEPDVVALSNELDHVVVSLKERLLPNLDARTLDQLLTTLDVVEHLATLQLSPKQLRLWRAHPERFSPEPFVAFLTQRAAASPALIQAITALFDALPAHERYYTLALERDEALATNTLKAMEEHGQRVAILVTGGFHTPGITARLKARGIAYTVIAPAASGDTDEQLYRSLLHSQVPPIETLVEEFSKHLHHHPLPLKGERRGEGGEGEEHVLLAPQGLDELGTARQRPQDPPQPKRQYLQDAWATIQIAALLSFTERWTIPKLYAFLTTHGVRDVTIEQPTPTQVTIALGNTTRTFQHISSPGHSRILRVVSVEHIARAAETLAELIATERGTANHLPQPPEAAAPAEASAAEHPPVTEGGMAEHAPLRLVDIEPDANTHEIVRTKGDLQRLINPPLLKAAQLLYDKNVQTISSSANQKDVAIGKVYLLLNYETLSEENKAIVQHTLGLHPEPYGVRRRIQAVELARPVDATTTALEIEAWAMTLAEAFHWQPMTWAPTFTLAELRALNPGCEDCSIEDFTEDGDYYYAPSAQRFYLSQEHWAKVQASQSAAPTDQPDPGDARPVPPEEHGRVSPESPNSSQPPQAAATGEAGSASEEARRQLALAEQDWQEAQGLFRTGEIEGTWGVLDRLRHRIEYLTDTPSLVAEVDAAVPLRATRLLEQAYRLWTEIDQLDTWRKWISNTGLCM